MLVAAWVWAQLKKNSYLMLMATQKRLYTRAAKLQQN